MKNLNYFSFCLLVLFFTGAVQAQVKIGNNPNSIDANSLLELESTNKGFLPPRVALTSVTSVSPLAAPVPTGMIVYNNGNNITNGHYTWNGNSWRLINTQARDNYVIVKSTADLPTPVSGIITLAANTVYEINGTVPLTSKINLNGSTIIGNDKINDQLLYTPTSGELFTGSLGGNIRNVTISATGAGARLFNVDAANNPTVSLVLEFVYIFNCDNVGLLKGFAGFVVFNSVAFSNNTNGLTLQDIGDYIELNNFWIADNKNTYVTLVGTFSTILIEGGKRHALSFFGGKSLDVSGITTITTGAELKSTLFVGDGTKVVGAFSNQWEVEATGLDTEKDAVASGNLYISTALGTTFGAANVPVKVLGTTTTASLYRVSSPVSNRLTYAGTKTRRFQVICSLSLLASGNNKNFTFYVAKNGVVLPESKQLFKCSSQVDRGSLTLSCTVPLAPNDYVEVWVANNSDGTTVTIESLNLAIK
jgi:hypothetical protein